MTPTDEHIDVAIVGAGPIGIELAVALGRAGAARAVLEAGTIGWSIGWWAPQTRFFSSPERIEIAGVPLSCPGQEKATRESYLAYLRDVVRQFDVDVRSFRRVVGVARTEDGFRVRHRRSASGVGGPARTGAAPMPADEPDAVLVARHLVLAIGDMHAPRRLGVPGEDLPHVSHFLDEPHRYFRRRVLVVGGKNSAVEAALRCYRLGAAVTISYRGDAFDPRRVKYWLRPEIEWLIEKRRIAWHPRTVPRRIDVDAVEIGPVDDHDAAGERVAADEVLLLTGYVQDAGLFEQLGLERSGPSSAPVLDQTTMQSSVPDVYVAGTATGGSQVRTRVFIENSHVHVDRICRAITGRGVAWDVATEYGTLEE